MGWKRMQFQDGHCYQNTLNGQMNLFEFSKKRRNVNVQTLGCKLWVQTLQEKIKCTRAQYRDECGRSLNPMTVLLLMNTRLKIEWLANKWIRIIMMIGKNGKTEPECMMSFELKTVRTSEALNLTDWRLYIFGWTREVKRMG